MDTELKDKLKELINQVVELTKNSKDYMYSTTYSQNPTDNTISFKFEIKTRDEYNREYQNSILKIDMDNLIEDNHKLKMKIKKLKRNL